MTDDDGKTWGLLGISQRAPPSNLQAEMALLGAILSNNKAYDRVSGFLSADHFADPVNSRIFQAIARRVESGQLADAVTLTGEFEHSGVLEEVGGTSYLAQLLGAMISIHGVGEYGRAVHDAWVRRRIIEICAPAANNAFGAPDGMSGAEQIQQIGDEIEALAMVASAATSGPVRRGNTLYGDAVHAVIDRIDDVKAGKAGRMLSTGLACVDRALGGGVAANTLNFMIGASEAGKSELALQIAESVALNALTDWIAGGQIGQCPGVLYIVLGDMTDEQLAIRGAARLAGVTARAVRRAEIDMLQAERLRAAREVATQIPMEISHTGPSTLARVLGDMRRFKQRRPLVLTVIDNFSDLLSVATDKMFGTAVATTKTLKDQGAGALDTSVLLLMHTNSSKERDRRFARPTAADIPWGTKKDTHFAFGVYRPFLYLDPSPPEEPKHLNDKGREIFAARRKEWQDAREPYPAGVRGVTEIVPMKLREADDDNARDIGKLRFDKSLHRFIDVQTEAAERAAAAWQEPM